MARSAHARPGTLCTSTKHTRMSLDEDWEEWNPSKGKFIDHMIAGSIAGMIEHVSIFPIDTIKTHMQCQRCPINNTPVHLSAFQTASRLVQAEGPLRLMRGVSTVFGACVPAHAAYFSLFEICKKAFNADGPDHTPLAAGAAGVCATIAHDLIMNPMDVGKQRLQLGYYSNVVDCFRKIVRYEGLGALYISFPTTFIMNAPYGMVMVATNESIKRALNPTGEHNPFVYFLSGAISGAIAAAVTNPLDVAKTRLQTQTIMDAPLECIRSKRGVTVNLSSTCGAAAAPASQQQVVSNGSGIKPHLRVQYRGLVDTLSQIYTKEGVSGLLKGMLPRLLVHTPSVAISWTSYEMVKNMLSTD